MSKALDNKIILITGASRGIGAAVARRCAAEGAHVLLTARTVRDLETIDDQIQEAGGSATLIPLDLATHAEIDGLGPGILEKFGYLDGFIANAGVLGPLTPLTHLSEKHYQPVIDVNVTANWRLIRILDPLLRKATHPRAAFVTSGVTQHIMPYWGPYTLSKTALETLALTYAAEADEAMRINLIDPGIVATAMRARAFPGEDPATLTQPDDPALTDLFVRAMSEDCAAHGQRLER